MTNNIIKVINFIIESIILLIIFLVPLYFSFYYQSFPLFSLDRAVLFKIFVEALTVLSLIKIILSKRILIYTEYKYFILPIVFFVILALITIFSIDPYKSFWGSYIRQQGLFLYLHYFLFFCVLGSFLADKRKIKRIINTILLGSLIVSLYGIMQWLGFEFINWQESYSQSRIISTLGQPVFLGNYLLLVIFLSLYKVIINKRFIFRSFYILLFLLQFFCLIFTYSRGAWLGFIFGVCFGILLYLYIKKKSFIKSAVILLLITIVVLSSFLLIINFSNSFEDSLFVFKVKSITNFKFGSLAMRLETWKASLAAISKSPLVGYGLEDQHEVLVGYYNPMWSVYEDINTASDRAHNLILDLMLEGGIVLLIVYLLLVLYFFRKVVCYLKKQNKEINWILFFLIAGLAAYHFSLLFSFSIIETNVIFWLYIGIIAAILSNYKEGVIVDLGKAKKIYYVLFIYSSIILCGFIIYFIIDNVNDLKADYYFKKARAHYLNSGNFSEMYKNYVLAINLNQKQEYYRWFFVNDSMETLRSVGSDEYRKKVLNYIEIIRKIDEDRQDNFSRLIIKAKVLTMLGKYEDIKYFKEAEESYKELISLSSFFPDSYKSWGGMYFLAGDYEKAIVINNEALSVLPKETLFLISYQQHKEKLNNFKLDIYEKLAISYLELENYDKSLENYTKIIKLNPYRLDVYRKIADINYFKGNIEKAIWYNKRGMMLESNNYNWPLAISLLYKEIDDLNKTSEFAQKALLLDPENQKIKNLIEVIDL
ncbi:MAG: O-antigen ligase family protein [Patescibacteria group bacterium]